MCHTSSIFKLWHPGRPRCKLRHHSSKVSTLLPSLPRSTRSTPSPPPVAIFKPESSRHHSIRPIKQRPPSLSSPQRPALGWSTSYQASASSSAGNAEESTEDGSSSGGETIHSRAVNNHDRLGGADSAANAAWGSIRRLSTSNPHREWSLDPLLEPHDEGDVTRTRQNPFTAQRAASPAATTRYTHRPALASALRSSAPCLLPESIRASFKFPYIRAYMHINVDCRTFGEDLLMIGALGLGIWRYHGLVLSQESHTWAFAELPALLMSSIIYSLFTSMSPIQTLSTSQSPRPSSPVPSPVHRSEVRRSLPASAPNNKDKFGRIWMSDTRNYRDNPDDGALTALLLGPLVATTMMFASESTLRKQASSSRVHPQTWLIEEPTVLSNSRSPLTALEALIRSRRNLVQLMTLSSGILLVHLFASRASERRYILRSSHSETGHPEKPWLPRNEGSRAMSYVGFTAIVTSGALGVKALFVHAGLSVWPDLDYFDVGVISLFYQFTLYVSLRLARRGFTLGELGLVAQGATALFMEVVNLTIARIWPVTTPFIKTFRVPTPLLIFQLAFIPGSLLTGFLLSPLLVLSRHIAQRPIKRLRFPGENQKFRRILALAFYTFAALIIGGLIGMWTRWCLGKRNPWIWGVFWLFEGRRSWSRLALLAYWGTLGIISVAGWNRQLARARRYRHLTNSSGAGVVVPGVSNLDAGSEGPASVTSTTFVNGVNVAHVNDRLASAATELLDAADKRVPVLGRNARRKFFHALAVVMFIPGLATDPAFLHLALSAAFALFVFAEYVRYFALYPFGVVVHLFLNEFVDHKDSGTAILSHFYLLTGCAGSLWLEGPSRILEFTGVLSLGVGDALASIVGRRIGRHRWSPSSSKTLEGSAAFVMSVVICAYGLRATGFVPPFSLAGYTAAVCLSAGLEALSMQNDNLTLPLYMWCMLVLLE